MIRRIVEEETTEIHLEISNAMLAQAITEVVRMLAGGQAAQRLQNGQHVVLEPEVHQDLERRLLQWMKNRG